MKYKILAVDDNPINTKLLARTLVNSEYEILTAGSGREALNIARKELPDLILLDVLMDDMDGYEVCTELQNQKETRHIPVIFLSAKNESVDKARGLAVGAVDYLTKPFDPVEINARVRTHLTIRKTAIRLQHENQSLKEQTLKLGDALQKLMQTSYKSGYHVETMTLSFLSQVKSQKTPQTTVLIPLFSTENGLLFILFNGFKKDYQTLLVRLLLEQFAAGYAKGHPTGVFTKENMQQLVVEVLERFSPDIYHVAFSFALGWLDSINHTMQYYSLKQDFPFLIKKDGSTERPQPVLLPYDGPHKELISAAFIECNPKEVFCFYRKGISGELPSVYGKMFAASLSKYQFRIKPAFEDILNDLPAEEDDQLVALFHFH